MFFPVAEAIIGGAEAVGADAILGAGADVVGADAAALAGADVAAGAGADVAAGAGAAGAAGAADLAAGGAAATDAALLGADTLAPLSTADALSFAPAVGQGGAGAASAPTVQAALTGAADTASGLTAASTPAIESPTSALAGSSAVDATLGLQDPALEATMPYDPSTAKFALEQQAVPLDRPIFNNGVETGIPGIGPTEATPASGFSSDVAGVLNSPVTKAAELGLPAAMLGYNLLKGPQPIPGYATQAVGNAQATAGQLEQKAGQNVDLFNQTAAQDLNLANNFQISPAQAASIQIYKQNAYNQLRQQIANQGNQNVEATSEWAQGKAQIDQQALAMQVQMINQLISTAFQAASAANAGVSTGVQAMSALDSTLMQAANLQVQQDTNFQNAIGSALQSFGMLAALSNLKVTGATTV